MLQWIAENPALSWIAAASLVMFVGTLILMPVMVVRMHEDYLLREGPPPQGIRARHPVLRSVGVAIKNVMGAIFVIAGLAMLVLPGQGLLSLFVGLSLLDFPGKHRLQHKVLAQRQVLRSINWMRAQRGKPPLRTEEHARAVTTPEGADAVSPQKGRTEGARIT